MALSFATAEIEPTASAEFPLQIYLTAGDLGRALDRTGVSTRRGHRADQYRTADDGSIAATQRVLIERVHRQSSVVRDLEEQIAARKKQSPATPDGIMNVGVDTFVALLPRSGRAPASGAFPESVCLVATDFARRWRD